MAMRVGRGSLNSSGTVLAMLAVLAASGAGSQSGVSRETATSGPGPERLHVIKIVTTQVEAEDLLLMVAAGLNIDGTHLAKAQLLAAIEKQLHAVARQGRRTLLIADEAQALPLESLEELRMLSNFQAGGYPLLQIFLLGQPEFRARHAKKLEKRARTQKAAEMI